MKTHPIHQVAFNSEYRELLSENFKKAFGKSVTPNIYYGQEIPLSIGEIEEPEGGSILERCETLGENLATFPQVHKQGDGIRSFTGILLYLMNNAYCTFLIDEPESFLHPPQANIIGRMIGELLSNDQQAFLSTHSQDLIKGLLDICPQRVKVVRITRIGDSNQFSVLENEEFSEIWNDPLLKHSEIMSSLFSRSTVLCEADADCKMYSIILSHLKKRAGQYSETLFIHCGGKDRMPKIIPALKSLNVDFRVVPDIDVLNNESVLKSLVESCGGTWEGDISSNYNIVNSALSGGRDRIRRVDTQTFINELLGEVTDIYISDDDLKKIRAQLKVTNKWTVVKESGISAIPVGDATRAFSTLNAELQKIGIFVVPCGELEKFIREVGGHGPSWVNDALSQYPSLDADQYTEIKEFVSLWQL